MAVVKAPNPDYCDSYHFSVHVDLTVKDIESFIKTQKHLKPNSFLFIPFLGYAGAENGKSYITKTFIDTQIRCRLPKHFESKAELTNFILSITDYIVNKTSLNIKVFGFAGTLPSQTNYVNDIINDMNQNWPSLSNKGLLFTSAHATTLACVTLNINHNLKLCNRNITNEIIGVLGCGSIGAGSLLTLLKDHNNEKPRKILLCDVSKHKNRLQSLKNDLMNECGIDGESIEFVLNDDSNSVKESFYQSTLIVGATNKPNVLDIWKCVSNCMICDDSAPHCFDSNEAIKRMEKYNDILFFDAGAVKFRYPTSYYRNYDILYDNKCKPNEYIDFSCCLGTQLLARFYNDNNYSKYVTPVIGPASYKEGLKRLKLLKLLNVDGNQFLIGKYALWKKYQQLNETYFKSMGIISKL